ncbi:snRNA-activating protein complex subunit 4-like isoform X2 [Argiope bruennichi]|uniref:snRNA-activating protein complex subunit 4-like isoform X2 n=1 Tax=Argiope bruennichi TaxID=94029 RepID=UPI002494BC43|nr:snRNA-activating protein complex subunit 4-like isoform X2 [Argiope bruennichi]
MFTNNTSQSISPKRRDLISDDLDELMKLNYHQYLKAEKEKSDKEALRNFIINCDEGSNDLDELMPFPSRQNLNGHPEENGVEELRDLIINIGEEANRKLEEICKENDEYNYNCKEMEKIASCSSLNMKLQYAVNKLLSKVQYTLDKRRKDKIAVEEYLEEVDNKNQLTKLKAKKYFKPISLFASPYFRDVRGMAPPENEDTTKKRENHDITAYVQPPRPWMLFEKHMLINAVYSNCLGFILKPYKTRRNYLRDKLKDDLKNLTEAEEASLKKQIKEIEKEINKQCRKYRDEVIIEAKDHIRWHEIALDGYRTGDECEIMWNNYMSIFVKKDPFTEEEDRKLKELVEKYSGKNWDAIAEELQTGRSAIQCFERYQRSLNTAMHKKYWTPEEDAKLAHLVESNKIGNFIPWNIVCSQMEGRERHQIINRYERTINNRIKRTPWTKEEDAMLLMCVKKYGCHWIQMKEYLPGRNPYTIRERYVNMLDPYIKHGPWSKAEDQKLIALTQKYGYGRWSRIAKEMKGRTDNMCLIRANNLGLKRGEEIDMKTHVKEELSDEYEFSEAIYGPRRKPTRTSMRADIQREALETLKSALMRVAPSVIDETMGTINVPCISLSLMRDLFKELFKNEQNKTSANWKPRYLSTDGISKIDFAKRKKGIKKKFGIDEESASEEEESENVPGIKIDRDSYFNEVHNVLRSQLYEIGNLMHLPKTIEQTNLSSRRAAELKILRTFYQQKLKCSSIPLEEEDFIFCGSNYNLTLADIIYRFVHPPPTVEDNAILLPPNLATLNGMDVMELAENRLNRTGKLINRKKLFDITN